jgi:hypothetical protein
MAMLPLPPTLPLPQDPAAGDAATFVEQSFRFLAAPPLWVVALILVPGTLAFAWWSYGGLARLETRSRVVLAGLRWLAIAGCVALACQPAFEITTYRRTRNQAHVLIDDSASMQRKDRYPEAQQLEALQALLPGVDVAATSRLDLVRAALARPQGLLATLAQSHDVRLFRMQRKPAPIRSLDEVTGQGARTELGDALDLHLAANAAANVDAVVVVSDGRNNAGLDPVDVAGGYALRGIPIHTVGVGDPEAPRNAWLVGPAGPREALRLEQVAFDVSVRAQGLRGRRARVELQGARDGGPYRPLATADAELPGDGEFASARVYCAFEDAGDWTLRFRLEPLPEESQTDDNEDVRFLRVNDEKIRVLYIDDRPRWEYRYVKNGLKRVDPSIVMQAVMFDASPYFEQEHSKELPPLRDLPRTEKELFAYHVVVFGDVPPERIAPTEERRRQWLEMLVRYVEFGGGVAFLFGDQAMPERYRNTPVQDLLPVVLEERSWLQANQPRRDVSFHPLLDNPTQPHDIVLLQRDPAFNRRLWEEGLPGFYVYHPVQRAKPGATVLLRHPSDGNAYGKRPIAVTGPVPRGNTFFLATDETWRWRDPYAETYMDTFWRNVVRWLARGRLQRRNDLFELTVDKIQVETGDKVRVQLRVQDDELQPSAAQEQTVFLRQQDGAPEKRVLRAAQGEPGVYQASFTMATPGAFSFLAYANANPVDDVLARQDVIVRRPDREMADSSQDAETLRRIAAASRSADVGGRYVFLAEVDGLAADLQARRPAESRQETRTRPAWDTGWSLAGILTVLAIEWLLRKRARLV